MLSFFSALTLLVGQQEALPASKKCWFVGGGDLTGALHVLYLQLSPPPPSSLVPVKFRNFLENGCQMSVVAMIGGLDHIVSFYKLFVITKMCFNVCHFLVIVVDV